MRVRSLRHLAAMRLSGATARRDWLHSLGSWKNMSVGSPASAHAPRDNVIVHWIVGINQLVSGCCHVYMLAQTKSNVLPSTVRI